MSNTRGTIAQAILKGEVSVPATLWQASGVLPRRSDGSRSARSPDAHPHVSHERRRFQAKAI